MSDELEAAASADRNFRSAYYKSLGFRDSDKSVSHLELLLKAEVYGMLKECVRCCWYYGVQICDCLFAGKNMWFGLLPLINIT